MLTTGFHQTERPPSDREVRWIRLKFQRSRISLRKGTRTNVGCLSIATLALALTLMLHGSIVLICILAIGCFFLLILLNEKRVRRGQIHRLGNLVESGSVHETRIVADRCFELQVAGEGSDEDSSLYFFDLGEGGIVTTNLRDRTPEPGFRKSRLFPYSLAGSEAKNAVTDLRHSIHRFPRSDFVVAGFGIEGRLLMRWVRCRGRVLKPTNNVFFSSDDEKYGGPGYEPLVVIPKSFDDCLRQVLEQG